LNKCKKRNISACIKMTLSANSCAIACFTLHTSVMC
jgi:hypothetical protein